MYGVGIEVGGALGGPRDRGGAQGGGLSPHPRGQGVAPLVSSFASIFYIFQNLPPWIFRSFRELLFSTHKTTSWQFCSKQRQSGLISFKSCKLESKTRAKVFGKVDTTETYQPLAGSTHYGLQNLGGL